MKELRELSVFITSRESICDECKERLGKKAWIVLDKRKNAFCLSCADLDHLIFLPSGDAALTRRSRKYSTLSAVVLRWSKTRKRYERQGVLVEKEAIELAEKECLQDHDIRQKHRIRSAEYRRKLDMQYVDRFALKIRELYPGCPTNLERKIAEHACLKHSDRVGRSAAAKRLDRTAIKLAVIAHIRHAETKYDEYLMMGHERWEAREKVETKVRSVLSKWSNNRNNNI